MGVGAAAIALTVATARRAAKLDDPADAGYTTGQQVSVRSTEAPRNLVFGEANVGGVFTYVNSAGSELRSLYYELVHTGYEIDSFQGWFIDDKYIPVGDTDVVGDGEVNADTNNHDLDPYNGTPVLYLRGHLGTSTQVVDSMLDAAFTDIGTNHRHRGCAKSVVRCELVPGGEDKWNGRSPGTITAVVRGFKCYDPRADGTFPGGSGAQRLATPSTWAWTDNPALIWAHYRTLAKPLGPAWDTSRIDYQSVFDAADDCDALVAIPTASTEKRFRCDLVVDTAMEPQEVVAQILATMAGSERHFNGQWHVYAGVWPTPDFDLDESDLVGPIQFRKQPETASQDRYNQVKGEYYDRERQWKLSPFLTVNDTSLRTDRDNGRTLTKHLRLEGVSREYQAQRLALRALRQAEDTGILVFQAGYSAANIRVGDTGTVSIDEFGWVNKTFRCVGVKAVDFLGYELTLKEDESVNYDDPAEGEYSTRTAAGEIVFGTVMPWYLQGVPSVGIFTPVLTNVTRNVSTYTKTGGTDATWNDAGLQSVEAHDRAFVSFVVVETGTLYVIGLDTNPIANLHYTSMDFAWGMDGINGFGAGANYAHVIVNGSGVVSFPYAVGDRMVIIRDLAEANFFQNGVHRYTYKSAASAGSYLDGSFYNLGASCTRLNFGPVDGVGTNQLIPEAATEIVNVTDATTGSFSKDTTGQDYGALVYTTITVEPEDVIDVAGSMRVVITLTGTATGTGGMRVFAQPFGGGAFSYGGALLTIDPADGSMLGSVNGSFTGLNGTYLFGLAGYIDKTDGGSDFIHCTASEKTIVINRVKR